MTAGPGSWPSAVPVGWQDVLRQVEATLRAQGERAFVVGGWLRDQYLGRRPAYLNCDLVVPRGALVLARRLAQELGGAFVPLDAGCARIVVARDASRLELDLCDFRGPTLEADLGRRDFTINAIAIGLADWLRRPEDPQPVVDPLGGRAAIARRELRACFPGTFADDPVRILRGFRFASQLGFTLAPEVAPLMAGAVSALAQVSGERVRDELLALLETDQAAGAVRALERLGALDVLIPELIPGRGIEQGGYHHLDVLGHELETVAQADGFLADFAEFSPDLRAPLGRYCATELVERRSRKSLIKLAGLLHDVGKPARRTVEPDGEIWFLGHEETGEPLAAAVVERLRLSNLEGEMVCKLVRHHLRPGFLSREPEITRRAVYRFFKELGDHGPGCLLTWWADRLATRGPRSRLDQLAEQRATVETLLRAYFFAPSDVVRPPRLLDGRRRR